MQSRFGGILPNQAKQTSELRIDNAKYAYVFEVQAIHLDANFILS